MIAKLHVPLIIVPPAGRKVRQLVKEPVSLRDIAATLVDLTDVEARLPFPGVSLARFWKGPVPSSPCRAPTGIAIARRGGPGPAEPG